LGSLISHDFALIHRKPALFPPYIVIASRDKLRGQQNPMKKLTLVVDERELNTIRAALLLLQEQVDALPEDLAEMLTRHGRPMTASEVEHLSLRLDGATSPTSGHLQQPYSHLDCTVEVKRLPGGAVAHNPT
jgi:hypothetical protein